MKILVLAVMFAAGVAQGSLGQKTEQAGKKAFTVIESGVTKVITCDTAAGEVAGMSSAAGVCWSHYGVCKATSWASHENCSIVKRECEFEDTRVKDYSAGVKKFC